MRRERCVVVLGRATPLQGRAIRAPAAMSARRRPIDWLCEPKTVDATAQ